MYLGLHEGSDGKVYTLETNCCINISMSKQFESGAQKRQKKRIFDLGSQQ